MVNTKSRKQLKAVSPVIATLLLILIAIAAGVVVYAYVLGFVGSSTRGGSVATGALAIEAADLKRGLSNANATIYLRNVGGVPTSLLSVSVFLVFPDGTELKATAISAFSPTSINPGSTASGTYQFTSSNVSAGQIYTVKVIADDGTSTVFSVRAHS